MRVSVISPSFDQARFLPFNLSSVENQTHSDVEHIVVDPGSTDGSREIAAKAKNITLIAEPDSGQSDGICKGFERSTGDILTWLNSDDLYPSDDILARVVQIFKKNPDADVVYGNVDFVGEDGEFLRHGFVNRHSADLLRSFQYQVGILQPGLFMRRRVFEAVGGPSDSYEYCMDYEYWVRIASHGFKWVYAPHTFAHHRWWAGMKTSRGRGDSLLEHFKVCQNYFGYIHWKWLDRYAEYLTTGEDGIVHRSTEVDADLKSKHATSVIERFVTQENLRLLLKSNDAPHRETLEYINKNRPEIRNHYHAGSDLKIASETSTDPLAETRVAWNIFDAQSEDGKRFKAYHVPNNFDRYFMEEWFGNVIESGRQKLEALKQTRRECCVIVGNGPSLRQTDLSLLSSADVIISNYAIVSDELAKHATILTIVNDLVAQQGAVEFNATSTKKVVPFWLANSVNATPETIFVSATVKPEFNGDIAGEFSWRSTVSFFNMQLAFALGYRKVLLVGFDHSYTQPEGVREGDAIDQKTDDENHFDPRYFRGKTWQAADTANMEAMYRLAKKAYEDDGREIVNCTVGGKLEVFRRGTLQSELSTSPLHTFDGLASVPKAAEAAVIDAAPAGTEPRILVFDLTARGGGTATGEIKANIFADWPAEKYLQVHFKGHETLGLTGAGGKARTFKAPAGLDALREAIKEFDPQLILYRPVPDAAPLHRFAMETIEASPYVPLATWIMDDWPARLEADDPDQFRSLNPDWLRLIERSALRLSIGDRMSEALEERYGKAFLPFANGVDKNDWPSPRRKPNVPFVLRYSGALAKNMTADSVLRIASSVEALAEGGTAVRFEIKTKPMWKAAEAERYEGLKHTRFDTREMPAVDYRKWLSSADAVVIGYNFDETSLRYTGLSMANKMPECLASGAPLLAHGPDRAATINYLKQNDCALVVDSPDEQAVADALKRLVENNELYAGLAAKGQQIAFASHDIHDIRRRFASALSAAARAGETAEVGPKGPVSTISVERARKVRVDETQVVAHMLADRHGAANVMLDVGAHHGTSAAFFDALGWTIHCFEPDSSNRERLMKRFGNAKNLTIDTRAVSDKPAKGISFFQSEESTGISGLHAFRDTHRESGKVDVTTVSQIIDEKGLARVDFLKIDVEGFDFSVLKGVPWDRLKPDVIECEFEDHKTVPLGHTYKEVAQFLLDKGYAVYLSEWHPIIRYGIAHDWCRLVAYPGPDLPSDAWGNILAFRNDPGFEAVAAAFEEVIRGKNPGFKLSLGKGFDVSSSGGDEAALIHPARVGPSQNKASAATIPPISPAMSAADIKTVAATGKTATKRVPVKSSPISSYTRVALWASARNPLVFRLGQFAMWCLRTARRQKLGLFVFALAMAGLVTGGIIAPLPWNIAAWIGAAGLAGLAFLVAVIGFAAHLVRRSADEIRYRLDAQERQLRGLQSRGSKGEKALRESLSSEIGRQEEKLARKLSEELQHLAKSQENLGSQLSADLDRQRTNLSSQIAESHGELLTTMAVAQAQADRNAQSRLDELSEKFPQLLDGLKDEVQKRLTKTEQQLGQMPSVDELKEEIQERLDKVEASSAETAEKLREIPTARTKAKESLAKVDKLARSASVFNMSRYQHFNRTLDEGQIKTLMSNWAKPLGLELNAKRLGYLAHRACILENQMKGRLATSVETIVLRSLVAAAPKRSDISILEIGTLFGIGAAAMYEAAANESDSVHLTVIDPLDGYYATGHRDLLTGAQINEATLRQNWALAPVPEEDFTILKYLSSDAVALELAAKREYDVLVIDGDHSYDGVKFDFENYSGMVRPDGYIIFDDYDNNDWPDIKRYVDTEIEGLPHLVRTGVDFRTAIYQVKKS